MLRWPSGAPPTDRAAVAPAVLFVQPLKFPAPLGDPGGAGLPSGAVSDDFLTLQDAADTLGVHYMTAYRYVRHGLLPARKVGGTWRVTVADLEAFRSGTPGAASDESGSGESRRRKAPWAERLEARLLAGEYEVEHEIGRGGIPGMRPGDDREAELPDDLRGGAEIGRASCRERV